MRNTFLSLAVLLPLTIGLTACLQRKINSKEAVLRQDLKTLRDEIDNYTTDKEKAPQTLQDLVDAGYLRKIPKDPFTESAETWQIVTSPTVAGHQAKPGISDVHSGSNLVGSDGTPYSSW